jgi:hypothetical protein
VSCITAISPPDPRRTAGVRTAAAAFPPGVRLPGLKGAR